MENPGECTVCFTTFEESERRPRTLPCGHTFCSLCIGNMMEGGQLSCPTCCVHHPATSATQFPISFIAEAFVKQLNAIKLTQTSAREVPEEKPPQAKVAVVSCPSSVSTKATPQKQSTGISRKLRSLLEEQKSNVSSVMADSQEVQSQLDQYRAQLADWKTQHLHLLDRLYDLVQQNKSALEQLEEEDTRVLGMKEEGEEGEKQMEAVLGSLQAVNTAQEVVTAIDHADHCTVEVEDGLQKCQELFPDVNIIKTTMKVRETTTTALEAVATYFGEGEGARMTLETEGVTVGEAEAVFHLVDPTLSIMEKVQYITSQGEIKVEDLCRMRPPVKRLVEAGRMYGVQEDQGGLRSSRITLENGQLYLHCLLNQPPPPHTHTLPVSEMVGALDPSSTLVFLHLSWPGSTRGRVHIRLSPDTSLARQLVLLCPGQVGHSYLTVFFLVGLKGKEGEGVVGSDYEYNNGEGKEGEGVVGGDYEYNNGKGGASLLHHSNHQYWGSGKAGAVAVLSFYKLESNISAQFGIITRDMEEGMEWSCVFGEVESGLEVVKAAINHSDIKQVTVVDCGVVVSL